jgi:uncharacterized protein (TIGR03086 family)
MHIDDIRNLDRRAVEASIAVVGQARPADLDRPTPCAEWTLRDLLEHMTAQHKGFRAASRGHGADLAVWQTVPAGTDLVGEYESAARDVIEAFAADGVPETAFALPEISTLIEFPAAQAIGFHLIDYVVHGWDVARALSGEYVLDDELAPAALRIAEKVPNGAERTLPSAAFRPGLAVSPSAPVLDRILAALGRSPAWPDVPSPAAH